MSGPTETEKKSAAVIVASPRDQFVYRLRRVLRSRKLLIIVALVVIGASAWYLSPWANKRFSKSDAKLSPFDKELTSANSSVGENNMSEALKHARKALELAPNDIDTILLVANLAKKENASDATQLYIRAFEEFKKQDDPDVAGKGALTYWAAAELAEQAGYIDRAKYYYEMVMEVANPTDTYEQDLVRQAKEALQRLYNGN